MNDWPQAAVDLLGLMTQAARGPRREGIYALWLTVRVAQGLLLSPPLPERLHRRRVQALEARLSSLTPPAPLKRALAGVMHQLREAGPDGVAPILAQLIAPARESAGAESAEALSRAAQLARRAT